MTDNVVYDISVPECVKIGYLLWRAIIYKKKSDHTPTPLSSPTPFKNPGYATVVLCTQNE